MIKFCGLFHHTVRISEFRTRVPFLRVPNLPVEFLLGTSFIKLHVKAILLKLRKVMFYHSLSVPSTGQSSCTKQKTPLTEESEDRSRKIRTTQEGTILLIFRAELQAWCPTLGLCAVQNTRILAANYLSLMAKRIMDIFLHKPFNVFLSRFFSCPVHVSRTPSSDKPSRPRSRSALPTLSSPIYSDLRRGKALLKISTVLRRTLLKDLTRTENNGDTMSTSVAEKKPYERTS